MSDDDLILAFLGGDRPAFDALFERYRGPIWAFFRRRTSTSADAEELAQETFLAVLQGARRYEPRASFRSYLFGIAFNVLLAWRRKTGRRGDESVQADTLAAPAHDPSSAIWIREALAALDPEDREILMLREYDALEYAEIARVTGVPINTVKSRLFRARMALREQLAGHTTPREDSESASAGARASGGGAPRALINEDHIMTLTHEVEREEVMAYLDGELAPARALEVRAHLDRCADCRAIADRLRDVSINLQEWAVDRPPATLVAPAGAPKAATRRGLLSSLDGRTMLGLPRWAFVAASCVAAALVLVVAGQTFMRSRAVPAAFGDAAASVDLNGAADRLHRLGYTSGRSAMLDSRVPSVETKNAIAGRGAQAGKAGAAGGVVGGVAGITVQTGGGDVSTTLMIVRTATISLSTDKFDEIRSGLERVVTAHHGSIGSLTASGDPPNQRSINATLRVPVAELDAALAGVRALGRVVQESQSSEDVTDAHRDLAIRISNSKIEEQRLEQILKDRTGKLSDVLSVEQEQSRVRTEIEQMEAQELAMRNRAALSTITVDVSERYVADLSDSSPIPIRVRLRNAFVDGARGAIESVVGVTLGVLTAAPTLLLWTALLFFPVRLTWRWARRSTLL